MINLPPNALPHLRRQRTEYANHSEDAAQEAFTAAIVEFAERAKSYLSPRKPQMRFIDIGCGIGFGLLGLLRVYGPEHRFVGVDRSIESPRTEDSKILYGFSETPSAYNSLQLTREILIGAGVPADHVECVDIDSEPFPGGSADIVTSTLAWGFHFPVEAYLEQVESVLVDDGALIIDVRRDQGQESVLASRFDVVKSWPAPHGKSDQMILKRKSA